MARRPFSKPVCAHEERNGLPGDDQGLSTAKPRSSHVLSTAKPRSSHVTWAQGETHPPPPVPPFLLAQSLYPKDIAGSDITS